MAPVEVEGWFIWTTRRDEGPIVEVVIRDIVACAHGEDRDYWRPEMPWNSYVPEAVREAAERIWYETFGDAPPETQRSAPGPHSVPPRSGEEDAPYQPTAGIMPPRNAAERKAAPLFSGVLAYFPDALIAVAQCSKVGNDQHNPGEPLHWAKEKSTDETDALARHLTDRARGEVFDADGIRHLAKVAWRALAALQREIEGER